MNDIDRLKEELRRAETACCEYEKTIYELNEDNKMKTERIDMLQKALVGEEKLKVAMKAIVALI